jgi:DNA repair exonuclease SbcCD nuclease subunit
MALRVLLLADTHLGFDLPLKPRVERRRRGPDFLANYLRALDPAFMGDVDVVVHGGDVFHRPRVHHTLVAQAFEPLRRIAESGIPVVVVPGNHERSRIPHPRFAGHPLIHVLDRPRTVHLDLNGTRVALFGFPYERNVVRRAFPDLVKATGWHPGDADHSLLCVHHCFEGATVGPADFTFRRGPDVIRCRDIPAGVAAVLTGHVHRHQVLTVDLAGRPLPAPVIYPGSVERTAFAEMDERKGYVILEVDDARGGATAVRWRFQEVDSRPMSVVEVRASGLDGTAITAQLDRAVERSPADAVLRIRLRGRVGRDALAALSAGRLRSRTPAGMNLEIVAPDEPDWRPVRPGGRTRNRLRTLPSEPVQTQLPLLIP